MGATGAMREAADALQPATEGSAWGSACLIAVTVGLLPLQSHLAGIDASIALAIPVLVAGIVGGWLASLLTASMGAFVLAVVLPPYWVPAVASPADRATVAVYAVAALGAGCLTGRAADRRRALARASRATAIAGSVLVRPVPPAGPVGAGGLAAPAVGATGRLVPRRDESLPLRPFNAYFGHHKCATSWIGDVLSAVCEASGRSHWATDTATPFADFGLDHWAFRHRIDVVSWTNADIRFVPDRPDLRAFHVIRDPRDMCISAYYSHRNSHPAESWPELLDVRSHLRSVDRRAGLAFEIEFLAPVFAAMENWDYGRPSILELRYEDLVTAPREWFVHITRFLGLIDGPARAGGIGRRTRHAERLRRALHLPPAASVGPDVVRAIVTEHTFETKSGGRPRGLADDRSHYRRGIAGEWRSQFSADHEALFASRYPNLIGALGYDDGRR